MRLINYISSLFAFWFASSPAQVLKSTMVCYSDFYPNQVKGYDYLIIEPSFFDAKDITLLKSQNKIILAYISLGEVNKTTHFYKNIKPYTIGENKTWNSRILDIRNLETQHQLNTLIDSYQEKGFDGVFMDNIDNYNQWGPTPDRLPDLQIFLTELRKRYPFIYLMQNAGLEIIDKTAPLINSLAIESVATDYDFIKKKYKLREIEDFKARKSRLENIEKKYQLPIIDIEYANTKLLKHQVLKRLNGLQWSIFIGNIELNNLSTLK